MRRSFDAMSMKRFFEWKTSAVLALVIPTVIFGFLIFSPKTPGRFLGKLIVVIVLVINLALIKRYENLQTLREKKDRDVRS
jgi:voltage-gated potassium channel Kch